MGSTMNKCQECQKDTNNPKFCSLGCHNLRKPKKYYCQCGNITAVGWRNLKSKFCDSCYLDGKINKNRVDWEKISISSFRKKFKNKYQFHARVRSLARLKKKLTPCEKCGYSIHVEVCHIVSVKDFDQEKSVAELNSPSNLICLCPNCHWEFDNPDKVNAPPIVKAKRKIPKGNRNFSEPHPKQRKVERPPFPELKAMIADSGYEAIGRKYGVTGNSVRKWVAIYEKHEVEE